MLFDASTRDWTDAGRAYIATLDRLGGHWLERLRYGRWVVAEGVVYADWDRALHIVDELPNDIVRCIRTVDFGYTNPFVCQWWAIDADGRMYLYRQIYMTGELVEDHARNILALTTSRERIEATICDHDAEDRATLERHGIPTIKAIKNIQTGLQAVMARLRLQGDGRPRLFVCRDCLVQQDLELLADKLPWMIEQEFERYVWPTSGGRRASKETPVDKDNHGMDAMRYGVMYVDDRPSDSVGTCSMIERFGRRTSLAEY